MNRIFLSLFFSALTTLCFGQVKIKNSGTSKLFVAICYYENSTGWTSKGWFQIEPNSEKEIYNYNQFNNPNFYYCATIENCDKGYYGDFALYVNTKDAFTIPNADKDANYVNQRLKKYKFKQVNLKGRSDYTIDLKPSNLTCNDKMQGKWTFSLDRDGEYAEKKEDAVYYREITFDEGRPIGWCKDFYADGKVKSEFKLVKYNPVVYDGKCVWYKQDGTIEKETVYKNGSPTNETAFGSSGETITKKVLYETVELPVQNFYINSTSNETWKGGSSKTVYPVELPEGTVEWYYEFSASRDKAELQANTEQFTLAAQLTSLVDKTGILKATVNMLTTPPGGDVCNVYLFDGKYYNLFLSDGDWRHYPTGSRLNYKSGIVQVRGLSTINRPMIGIKNPDGYNGIHVSLQVVAIVSKLQ